MKTLSQTTRRLLAPVFALSLAAAITGCTETRDAQIRADLTPELETLHERKVDQDNNGAITFDEDGRMFWEDMGRFWMTDRPSRLTKEPIARP